jgi:hypothetical protein
MCRFQECPERLGTGVRICCQSLVSKVVVGGGSIPFPVTGQITALAWCSWDQWLFPRGVDMWAVPIPQSSSWDKLRRERFHDRVGTLGGEGLGFIGVATFLK